MKPISLTTAAASLGISTSLLRRHCRDGRANAVKLDGGGWIFTAKPKIKPGRPAGRPRKDVS